MVAPIANIEKSIKRASAICAHIGVILLLGLAFLVVADGLSRWLFSAPIHGLEDVNGLVISVIVTSFFPVILIERQNIRVTIVGRFLTNNAAAWLDIFGHFVLLIFFSIIAWQFSHYVYDSRQQLTLILRLPTMPSLSVTAFMLLMCIPIQGFVLFSEIVKVISPEPNLRDTT